MVESFGRLEMLGFKWLGNDWWEEDGEGQNVPSTDWDYRSQPLFCSGDALKMNTLPPMVTE